MILNGASSSGKTTIATGFLDQRAAVGDFWLLIALDDFLAKLPVEWLSVGSHRGTRAREGIRFERGNQGIEVRVGEVARKLLRAYQAGVAAAARVGVNVIVDDVVIDGTHWDDWGTTIAGLDVTWVGVRCSPDVAEQRERWRDDHRLSGLARAQAAVVHRYPRYDFEVDTTTRTRGQALSEFLRHLGY